MKNLVLAGRILAATLRFRQIAASSVTRLDS